MKGTSRFPRALLNNKSGFTFIEALLVTAIIGFIMAGLFYVLSTGELSSTVSYTRVNAQSQARRVIDWVTRDARLARTYDIGSAVNDPSDSHIRFQPVTGWDHENLPPQYKLSSDAVDGFTYIEYTYDPGTDTLTRSTLDSAGNVVKSWVFPDITTAPFFTLNTSGEIVPLGTDIQQSKVLIVSINVRKQGRNNLTIDSGITTQVRIRNG